MSYETQPSDHDLTNHMNLTDLAELCGVTRATTSLWHKAGLLESATRNGREVCLHRDEAIAIKIMHQRGDFPPVKDRPHKAEPRKQPRRHRFQYTTEELRRLRS